jgi:hypothetical protein
MKLTATDIVVDCESYLPGSAINVILPEGCLHDLEYEFC